MPHPRFADVVRLFSALVFGAMLTCAQAAELGDAIVRSHAGQPLVADIELSQLADPSVPVSVRLAHADVYRGANIGMHPILSGINMSVMRRDGRQFLHITSVRPVQTENIHLFLDLVEGGRRNVRAVTLWITPDPSPPPPPPKPLPAPPPIPAPEPVVSVPAVPSAAPVARKAPIAAAAPDVAPRAEKPWSARVIKVPSAGAACPPPQFSDEQIKSCAAMDYTNGLLSAQIVELEEKVKLLQQAMEGKTESAAPPVAAAKKAPPPPSAPAKAAAKTSGGFPWLLVIGAALALAIIGGGVWFFLSRRKGKTVETAAADSVAWYSRLTTPFKRKPKTVVVEVVEEAKAP